MSAPEGIVTVKGMTAATFSPDVVADLVTKISPSLVRVDAGHRFGGTGTAWAEDLVVTASHVVERDEDIELGMDGDRVIKATLVGRDETTNLAVLRTTDKLTPASFRGLDGLRVGHFVVAVARPGKTVRASFGIVSTLGADFQTRSGGRISRWLETDADIAAGWSGGALLDLGGGALGINNRGVVRHAHLTLPKDTVERVVNELVAHGKVRRGYLGVGVHRVVLPETIAKAVGQETGALVHAVEPKSHAETAGVLLGDVIVSVDGAKVESPWSLASVLRDKVDVEVTLQVVRAGKIEGLKART
jgi:S1-C subfamily serine protease